MITSKQVFITCFVEKWVNFHKINIVGEAGQHSRMYNLRKIKLFQSNYQSNNPKLYSHRLNRIKLTIALT